MRRKENYIGIGSCPVCGRVVYFDEVKHKLVFSCRVHPCVREKDFQYYLDDRNTDYWRDK